jgi:putative flippase GtrA
MALSGTEGAKHAQRFVKFCIVGASSVVVQYITLEVFVRLFAHLGCAGHWVVPTSTSLGAIPAIVNGFYWNRRWTFQQSDSETAGRQFRLFVAVNLVGIALNYSLMYVFNERLRLFHTINHARALNFILTVACVTFWNFYANSRWTFRVMHAS